MLDPMQLQLDPPISHRQGREQEEAVAATGDIADALAATPWSCPTQLRLESMAFSIMKQNKNICFNSSVENLYKRPIVMN